MIEQDRVTPDTVRPSLAGEGKTPAFSNQSMNTPKPPNEFPDTPRLCGDGQIEDGRTALPGAYAFFARYILLPWESCLDVGGGLGVGRRILLRRSRRVRSIDADCRLTQFGVEPGRIESEPDGSYDWVVAVDVIEHVEDDAGFLAQLLRVARKGIYVTTPNREHHPDLNWPYHVREYAPVEFAGLFARVAGGLRRWHWGGDVHCGGMSRVHLGPAWEHQAILAWRVGWLRAMTLLARERWVKCRI